uniref:Uncharacterized protein n=1 Tax=Tanacetum cinerariifolium TaxID=118510 RepID=A0A6L2NQF9_TANCI|nr:hypothetical protein [Tanacetum cinerariifolium]
MKDIDWDKVKITDEVMEGRRRSRTCKRTEDMVLSIMKDDKGKGKVDENEKGKVDEKGKEKMDEKGNAKLLKVKKAKEAELAEVVEVSSDEEDYSDECFFVDEDLVLYNDVKYLLRDKDV